MSRGYCFIAEVVGKLDKKPRTTKELHEDMGEPIQAIPFGRLLNELTAHGVIYVADWKRVQPHGKPARVFAVGNETPATPPPRADGKPSIAPVRPSAPKRHAKGRTMVSRFAALWDALSVTSSAHDLAQECGLSEHDIRFALHAMKGAGLVRIGHWDRARFAGNHTACWERSRGRDKPKPEPMTEAEYTARATAAKRDRSLFQTLTFLGRA